MYIYKRTPSSCVHFPCSCVISPARRSHVWSLCDRRIFSRAARSSDKSIAQRAIRQRRRRWNAHACVWSINTRYFYNQLREKKVCSCYVISVHRKKYAGARAFQFIYEFITHRVEMHMWECLKFRQTHEQSLSAKRGLSLPGWFV